MARRRRAKRKKSNNSLVITQIIFLVAILAFILIFRGNMSTAMSGFLGSFGSTEDVQVKAASSDAPPPTPDEQDTKK